MNDHAFNLVTGVLALISAVTAILGYYHSRLPSQRMETFDKIFAHAKELLTRAREDGLITTDMWWMISATITQLEVSALAARTRVYAPARGLGAYAMRRELSKEINDLIEGAEALRLLIIVSAQRQLQLQSPWKV
ncbi:hypothetical protein BD779DRAFT_1678988 [Infundibulicybe gibba]|nr:hypothetical protein BD779DRAFT_1678988 [Infundibulicybe gibba]